MLLRGEDSVTPYSSPAIPFPHCSHLQAAPAPACAASTAIEHCLGLSKARLPTAGENLALWKSGMEAQPCGASARPSSCLPQPFTCFSFCF